MKRIITTILFVTVFSILYTVSAIADVKIDYNPDTLSLSVSGKFEDSSGKSVTLQVLKPGNNDSDIATTSSAQLKTVIHNIKETSCDLEGIFSFTPFKISGTSGYYGVRVCVNGKEPEYYDKAFLYVSPDFESDILSDFNDENVSVETLTDKLVNGSEILQFPELASYSDAQACEIIHLVTREAVTCADITRNVNLALAVHKINNTSGESDVENILAAYSDYIEEQCCTYSAYDTMNSTGKRKAAGNIIKNKEFDSVEDFIDFFGEDVVFTSIYTMDNYLQLEEVLKASEEWFGADFSSYYSLTNKKKAALEIIGKQYDDIDKLKLAVKNAISNADVPTSNKGSVSNKVGSVVSVPQTNVSQVVAPVPELKPVFADMADAQWAVEAVEALSKAGIINGVSLTEFAPNSHVTREQFAKMVVLAFGNADMHKSSHFVDCPGEHWSSPYVAAAFESGIVNGISNTEFGIGQSISRQDMAVMLYRAAKNAGVIFNSEKLSSFDDDADIAPYADEAINALVNNGIISGMGDGRMAPLSSATRAQAAKMIYGLIKGGVS